MILSNEVLFKFLIQNLKIVLLKLFSDIYFMIKSNKGSLFIIQNKF